MLVGNKCDESAELREVTATEGQAEAANWGISFMETSAKTNHNVTELFQVSMRRLTSAGIEGNCLAYSNSVDSW